MNQNVSVYSVHRLVWISLLAALTGVGAIIAIPLGPVSPVPVTLQTMFVLLGGLVLGARGGVAAMLLYMAAGAMGLPVFSGGKAGLAVFIGPTGGYLISFLAMAWMTGIWRGGSKSFMRVLLLCVAASLLNLVCGSLQLAVVLKISTGKALAMGMIPFLPGGLAKCVAAAAIYRFMAQRKLLPL